jgi:hypothetical protein
VKLRCIAKKKKEEMPNGGWDNWDSETNRRRLGGREVEALPLGYSAVGW